MRKLPFLTIWLFTVIVSKAQTDPIQSESKQKPLIASVSMIDNRTFQGKVYAINDSQVVLVKSINEQQAIPGENIRSFSLKRKNSVLRGALIGLGIGAVTGIVIGLASGDDPVNNEPQYDPISAVVVGIGNAFALTAGQKALGAGVAFGGMGAIAGAVIGALAKKKFTIGGSKQKFRDLQAEIMMKLVQK